MSTFNQAPFGGAQPGYVPTPPASVLTYDVIYSAYRIAGILRGPQRGLSVDEIQEGLQCFNDLVDSYNIQRYTVLSIRRQLFNLIANQGMYEIGPTAADWVTPRPPKIENASVIDVQQNPVQPLEIPLYIATFDIWQLIPQKNITSTWPQVLWYDPAQDYLPNAQVNVWPVPQINNQIAIYAWSQIAQSVNADTPLILAPGYKQALQYELAVELCPRWNRPVSPDVAAGAIKYKKDIKSVNLPTLDLRCDPALVGTQGYWNYRTGGFGTRGGYNT